eukprot:m.33044 g.33044  ORF g.33044 m.33044 type:complete len:569 (-) comp16751_c0_seq1:412-2118(-)
MDEELIPVLVGVGRHTQHADATRSLESTLSPLQLMSKAARKAAADAVGVTGDSADRLLEDVGTVATIGMFYELTFYNAYKKLPYTNFSRSVANDIGATPLDSSCYRSFPGGNGPQFCVNYFADLISRGAIKQGPILIGGAEAKGSLRDAVRAGRAEDLDKQFGWSDAHKHPKPITVNRVSRNINKTQRAIIFQQLASELEEPLRIYPMLENAYAHALGRTDSEHSRKFAELFSRFSAVAAAQPTHSFFPVEHRPEALLKVSSENRMLSYPYTKLVVARDEVNQSAAMLMMSLAEAKRRRICEKKLVYLWGCGTTYDDPIVALRHSLSHSASMMTAYTEAFRSAGLDISVDVDKIAAFDIYSCFPIAVEQACECLSLDPATTDISRLTATGGHPYHGGPGSNYSSHGICAIVEKLRTSTFRDKFGMVCANGGHLTEHSVGIYSTTRPQKPFEARDLLTYAGDYALPLERYALTPNGRGKIITWTIDYNKNGVVRRGLIIGEMVSGPETGKRFCAITRDGDTSTVRWLRHRCATNGPIGCDVVVTSSGEVEQVGMWSSPLTYFSRPTNSL